MWIGSIGYNAFGGEGSIGETMLFIAPFVALVFIFRIIVPMVRRLGEKIEQSSEPGSPEERFPELPMAILRSSNDQT